MATRSEPRPSDWIWQRDRTLCKRWPGRFACFQTVRVCQRGTRARPDRWGLARCAWILREGGVTDLLAAQKTIMWSLFELLTPV